MGIQLGNSGVYLNNIIPNFFSKEELERAWTEIEDYPRWRYTKMGGGAYYWQYQMFDKIEEHHLPDLEMNFTNVRPIWKEFYDKMVATLDDNFKPWRYLLNGQIQCQPSKRHTDFYPGTSDAKATTLLVYLNKEWDNNWSGETLFYSRGSDDPAGSIFPEPGKLLDYDGRIRHHALPPNAPNILRTTLVVQGTYA